MTKQVNEASVRESRREFAGQAEEPIVGFKENVVPRVANRLDELRFWDRRIEMSHSNFVEVRILFVKDAVHTVFV